MTLMLVDAASLYFRAFHGVPESITGPHGRPVNAVRGYLDMTATLVERRRPTRYVACLDLDWRPRFRTELLPSYKAHRVAPQGPNGQLFDADNIPAIALERIEVVADGGSAIYGSDAIAGVVNYIIRRPDNVFEVQFRAGFADSVQEYTGSAAFGRRWGSGDAGGSVP